MAFTREPVGKRTLTEGPSGGPRGSILHDAFGFVAGLTLPGTGALRTGTAIAPLKHFQRAPGVLKSPYSPTGKAPRTTVASNLAVALEGAKPAVPAGALAAAFNGTQDWYKRHRPTPTPSPQTPPTPNPPPAAPPAPPADPADDDQPGGLSTRFYAGVVLAASALIMLTR